MKNNGSNLYFLSTIACRLSECLDEASLEMLSADLTTLGYMLESIQARRTACGRGQGLSTNDNES